MYLAIDSGRVDGAIQRVSRLIRHFNDIHGQFVSISRQIDMDVKNKEAIRIALRSLEHDMESIGRALRKMMEVSEDIIAEYNGAHRENLRDCQNLVSDIEMVSQWNSRYDELTRRYSFKEYIDQINGELTMPVSITSIMETETLERYGIRAIETDIEGNVPVLAWRVPEFK